MALAERRSACLNLSPSKAFLEKLFTEIIEKKWGHDLTEIASTGKISPELIEKGIKFLFDNYDSNGDYKIEELVKYRPSKKLTLAEIELLAEKE